MNNDEDFSRELQHIGLRIAYFLKLRKMTQAALAEKLHINKYYLSQIECGLGNKSISLPLLIKMSKVLEVELSALVDLDDMDRTDTSEEK